MRAIEKNLRERIKFLEKELEEVKQDRQKFRDYWAHKIRWFIEIHGKGSHPDMTWLIEDMAKFLARVKWWYW